MIFRLYKNFTFLFIALLFLFSFSKIQAAVSTDTCAAPVVFCSEITENSIKFIWAADPAAEGYEVNVNETGWTASNFFGIGHIADGFTAGTEVSVAVRPLACPEQVAYASCQTYNCPFIQNTLTTESILCNGAATGALQITATTGTAPFTFYGADGTANDTGYFENLSSGSHTFWIEDANGCTKNISTYFFEPAPIEITTDFIQHIDCNNATGSTQVSTSGGAGDISLVWNDGQTGSEHIAETAGTYTVTATDANGCTATAVIETFNQDLPNLILTGSESVCYQTADGHLSVVAENAVNPLSYQWSENAGAAQTSSVSDLPAGSYTVTVSNETGCTKELTAEIAEEPEIIVTATTQPALCAENTGSVTLTVENAEIADIIWAHDVNNDLAESENLAPGSYSAVLTTPQGCTAAAAVEVIGTPAVTTEVWTENVTCHADTDGYAALTVTTGTAPYSIAWQDGASSDSRSDLPAGTFSVTVTDAHDCTVQKNITVNEPAPLTFTYDMLEPTCHAGTDGSITVMPDGGTGDYFYSADGVNTQTENSFSDLTEGSYLLSVTDENNCAALPVSVDLPAPLPISIDIAVPAELPTGKEIELDPQVSGGTGALTFAWESDMLPADNFSCTNCARPTIKPSMSGDLNLKLQVTDENNCQTEENYKISLLAVRSLYLPTAFSPNGDANNEVFKPLGQEDIRVENFSVYSRNGNLLHREHNLSVAELKGWQGNFRGETASSGVYAYTVTAVLPTGEILQNQGEVTLVR